MPPLARNLVDTNAVQVFTDWINSLPGTPALAPPTITPNGGTFIPSVSVTLQAPDANATLYYTLNGTLPTTNSLLYSSPLLLTSNVVLTANAFETGFDNSVAASALFNAQPLRLISAGFSPINGFQLQLLGMNGSNYVLQASTNFIEWTPLITNTGTTNLLNLMDTDASNFQYRFYRVLQQ